MRRPGTGGLSEAALRHAASCPACSDQARAALLLRLGSEPDEGAAPRPGFEERLRARLAAGPAAPRKPVWNGGFELLVRPALAIAATLTLLCAGIYIRVAAPERGGDLASLVETDPVFTSMLGSDPEAIFAGPQNVPDAMERP